MARSRRKSQQAGPQDSLQQIVPQNKPQHKVPQHTRQNVCPPQVSQKLWRRFYEPLVLMQAYGKSQGSHFKKNKSSFEDYPDSTHRTTYKRFLDALAYSCDYLPAGATVTAVAIQVVLPTLRETTIQDAPELVYWVASNTDQTVKLKPHLNDILGLLSKAHNINADGVATLEDQIFRRMIKFSSLRLLKYRARLSGSIKTCIQRLEGQHDKESNSLRQWLVSLDGSTLNKARLCRICYESQNSKILKIISRRAGQSSINKNDTSTGAQYARLRHYIGRLGSHMKAAQVLVGTGRVYPDLFLNFSIQIATSHPSFVPPSYRNESSINGIIERMISNPEECESYQIFLDAHDKLFQLNLQQRIKDEYESTKFELRVHAEVILLDLFRRKGYSFHEGTRYIGVSKPSCFLCYRYFQAHPLQVETSGCSNNLYLQWQPPYIQENSPDLVKEQTQIMNTMMQKFRLFILNRIKPGYRGIAAHPDSTTGLDTISYIDRFETLSRGSEYSEIVEYVSEESVSSSADLLSSLPITEDESEDIELSRSSSFFEKTTEGEGFAESNIVGILMCIVAILSIGSYYFRSNFD